MFDTGFCTDWTHFTVERFVLETQPCPLNAMAFSDDRMQTLADRVGRDLVALATSLDGEDAYYQEKINAEFWTSLERNAIDMGMQYYDDTLNKNSNY